MDIAERMTQVLHAVRLIDLILREISIAASSNH
jgi:hypothetical protein